MDQMSFELPELDRKKTKQAVEDAFEKYRIFKYLTFDEREAGITASYSDMPGSKTNVTSDQTALTAIYNVDTQAMRLRYCERIERAVKRLPWRERFLVEKRYLVEDASYITDTHVYCFVFDPPISAVTYANIRWKAFYQVALYLNIAVKKNY